jgi:hypothetical protein
MAAFPCHGILCASQKDADAWILVASRAGVNGRDHDGARM